MVEKRYLCRSIANINLDIFELALNVCEKLILKIFAVKNSGQGYGGENLNIRRSIANVLMCIAKLCS